MPIEIEIIGQDVQSAMDKAFAYLVSVDERFSTYKKDSEISRINKHSHILKNVRMSWVVGE